MLSLNKKIYWRSWISILALLWAMLIPPLLYIFYTAVDTIQQAQAQKVMHASQIATDFANEELVKVIQQTKIISKNIVLRADCQGLALHAPQESLLEQLALTWQTIANESGNFDQIRWIANDGTELLRINDAASGAYRVTAQSLQNKADRYYVKVGAQLAPDNVYYRR